MTPKTGIALLLCLACAWPEDAVCHHADRGESRMVDLDAVARAQDEVKRRLSFGWEKAPRLTADQPFESGLPACSGRQTRRLRTSVPAELVGKSIAFAPSDRMFKADVRVATSARRIVELDADALADRALSERLGVRCTPTLVRAISEVELELAENP